MCIRDSNYVWTVPVGATNPGNVASFTSGIAGTYSVVITNTVDLTAAAITAGSSPGMTLTYWTDAAATVAPVDPPISATTSMMARMVLAAVSRSMNSAGGSSMAGSTSRR